MPTTFESRPPVPVPLPLEDLDLPPGHNIESITYRDYVDSIGDPSWWVQVTLRPGTTDEDLAAESLFDAKTVIQDYLLARDRTRFPYISVATHEELAELERRRRR